MYRNVNMNIWNLEVLTSIRVNNHAIKKILKSINFNTLLFLLPFILCAEKHFVTLAKYTFLWVMSVVILARYTFLWVLSVVILAGYTFLWVMSVVILAKYTFLCIMCVVILAGYTFLWVMSVVILAGYTFPWVMSVVIFAHILSCELRVWWFLPIYFPVSYECGDFG